MREAFASFVALESSPASCNAVPILMAQSAFETGNWAELICFNSGNFKRLHGADYCYFATEERIEGSARLVALEQPYEIVVLRAPRRS